MHFISLWSTMYTQFSGVSSTCDHRVWKTGLPVRSAVLKPHAGWLVVGWVTTSESQLLHVSISFLFFHFWFLTELTSTLTTTRSLNAG